MMEATAETIIMQHNQLLEDTAAKRLAKKLADAEEQTQEKLLNMQMQVLEARLQTLLELEGRQKQIGKRTRRADFVFVNLIEIPHFCVARPKSPFANMIFWKNLVLSPRGMILYVLQIKKLINLIVFGK